MLLQVCALLFLVSLCLTVDLTYRVQEEKSPGTYIGDIAADTHLMDSVPQQDRRLIRFSLLEPDVPDVPQLFRVAKKTGKLYTTQTLDAESLCVYNSECYRIIHLAVRRVNSFIRILKVRVFVVDINDHQPEFPNQKINIQFSEGDWKGKKKLIPNALDKDVSIPNSQITYQLQKDINQPFTLLVSESVDETFDLRITLEERLDREMKDSYLIQVIATDGGSPAKQSVLDVHISVTDVNDNAPVFSKNVYNVSVKNENHGLTPITILSASDLDVGKNGRISYHFSSKTSRTAKNHFELNQLTGEIFLQKTFASGQKLTHKLYVKATDGGSPPLSSVAMVLVNVISQQNNAPTIDVNFVSSSTENKATISEDIEVGSFMAYVKVTDHDAGPNGEVTCGLYHDKFQLEILGPKEYKVTVKSPVDREIEDQHDFTISCQDKGSPTQHTESKFSIQVIDVNDVRPQFLKETFKFLIHENQKSNFPVGYINATDPDLGPGGKLTYSLPTEKNQFLPFQIMDDGLISTVISLDYEFQNIYKFPVFVEDNGIPSLNNTVSVVIEVRDCNDNAPYFTFPGMNPFSLNVDYHPYHPNNITVLKASDSDSRENAFLKYKIASGNDKQLFSLNQYTGLLSFKHSVTQQDAGSYILQITVRDSGIPVLSATTTLSLRLTVNNKTSEILNTVHLKTDYQVHMYLLITVVLVAVTVSVPLTAAISICIIRCYNQRDAPLQEDSNPSCKFVNEQGNLVCRSQLAISWPDVPMALNTDWNMAWNSLPTRSKQTLHPAEELASSPVLTTLGMKIHTAREVTYEEIAGASGVKGLDCRAFVVPNYHGDVMPQQQNSSIEGRNRSKLACIEATPGATTWDLSGSWSNGDERGTPDGSELQTQFSGKDTRFIRPGKGAYLSTCDTVGQPQAVENHELSSSLISRLQNLDQKPILQTFSPCGSPKNLSQSLCKPDVSSVPGLKATSTDTESLASCSLSESRESDLNPQHLATVPQFSHADYSQQMEYSKTLYKLTSHQLFHSNTRLSK